MKPFINIADAKAERHERHGKRFQMSAAPLAERVGGRLIGANVTTVPPGKAAWPFHHHHVNEEHFFILRGRGRLRWGEEAYEVREGDYIVNPPGGPEHAHQLVNCGDKELVYLAISTLLAPEVVGYPDSAKTGVRVIPYGTPGSKRWLVRNSIIDKTQYWDGEDGAQVGVVLKRKKGK